MFFFFVKAYLQHRYEAVFCLLLLLLLLLLLFVVVFGSFDALNV